MNIKNDWELDKLKHCVFEVLEESDFDIEIFRTFSDLFYDVECLLQVKNREIELL